MINPIGWIEIPVIDLDRAEAWYHDYFGFEFTRQPATHKITMSWFPMDMKSYGSAATLAQGNGYQPSVDGPLIYFSAPGESIDNGVEKAKSLGIEILLPKTDIGDHGYFAIIKDSEGNRIAIHAMK